MIDVLTTRPSGCTVRRAAMPFILPCLTALSIMLAVASSAAEKTTSVRIASDYWATRQGLSARVLLMIPAEPRGGVMLLPGGHGNINLDVQAQLGWGHDDFVIRTRANYPQSGFTAVIPDIAIDRKPPAKLGDYRQSEAQAYDLRALSGGLRRMADRVFVVAYDRGTTSALNAAARDKMDLVSGLVLISPILEPVQPSSTLLEDGARLAFAKMPVLMISHASDGCSAGATNDLNRVASMVTARDFRAVSVTGGSSQYQLWDPLAYHQDSCNRQAPHAMAGLEDRVSSIIIEWLQNNVLTNR
jgi:pimeloyl-ACP methyl ester carboxylesterase